MVELLAAIVILGILSTIGISSVYKIIDKSKENYYKTSQNTMLEAGETYVLNNRSLLPKNIGEVKTYTLQDLYDAKVLTEKLTDENKEECDANKSKFYVYKASTSSYKYSVELICPSCKKKGDCNTITKNNKPTATITYTKCGSDLENEPIATVSLNGNNSKIVSYTYKIIKNKKTVYSSESIRTKAKENIKFKIDLKEYVPGPLKIKVTLTNEDGITSTITEISPTEDGNPYCSDYHTVECGDYSYEAVSNTYIPLDSNHSTCSDNDWINASNKTEGRKVWVNCNNLTGTACKEPTYSSVFTKDSTTKTITISDLAGNTNNCTVATCIDKTYPTINVNIYKRDTNGNPTGNPLYTYQILGTKTDNKSTDNVTDWINKASAPNGVVIVISSTDKTSKMKKLVYQTKSTSKSENEEKNEFYKSAVTLKENEDNNITLTTNGYQQYKVTGIDKAGNTSIIEFAIKLDNTPPTCTSSGGVTSWQKNTQTIYGKCSDKGFSGCVGDVSNTIKTNTNTTLSPGTVKDYAGNSTPCDAVQVKVDACQSYSNTWTKKGTCRCSGDKKQTKVKYSTTGSGFECATKNFDCSSSCCTSISLSGTSDGAGTYCPKNGEAVNQDHKLKWTVGECTEGLSGHVCYYNLGTVMCNFAKATYSNEWHGSASPNPAGHIYFKGKTWYYMRSTEYGYAYACNKNNHCDSKKICTGTHC